MFTEWMYEQYTDWQILAQYCIQIFCFQEEMIPNRDECVNAYGTSTKYLWGFPCIVTFPWHSWWEQPGGGSWRNSSELPILSQPLLLILNQLNSKFVISYLGSPGICPPWRLSRACEGDQVANMLLKWDEAVICVSDIALFSIPSGMLQPWRNGTTVSS